MPSQRREVEIRAPEPRETYPALTAIRGVAAVFVILFHLSGGFFPYIELRPATFLVGKSYLFVDFFLALSGFVLVHAYERTFATVPPPAAFARYLGRRIRRIYPMHVAVLALFLLLETAKLWIPPLAGSAFQPPRTLAAAGWNLAMLQGFGFSGGLSWNVPSWTLSAEMAAYLVLPLIVFLLVRLRGPVLLLAYAATIAGLAMLAQGSRDLDLTGGPGLVRCLLDFAGGAILYRLWSARPWRWLGRDATAVTAFGGALLLLHLNQPGAIVVPVFGVAIVALAANEGRVRAVLSARPLQWFGRLSFAIYMTHYLLIELAQATAAAATGGPVAAMQFGYPVAALVTAGFIALTVLVASALDRLVERPGGGAPRGVTMNVWSSGTDESKRFWDIHAREAMSRRDARRQAWP